MAAVIMEDTASGTVFSLILSNIQKNWNEGSVKCTVDDGGPLMSTAAFITVYCEFPKMGFTYKCVCHICLIYSSAHFMHVLYICTYFDHVQLIAWIIYT